MNFPPIFATAHFAKGSFFFFDEKVSFLIRSADWYKFRPIDRYILNIAASAIWMEDCKTEARDYTHANFVRMAELVELGVTDSDEASIRAWADFWRADISFGVVHHDQRPGRRGNIILGDCPQDVIHFHGSAPDVDTVHRWPVSSHGIEGSDA